jgi:hypothetical protein
VVAATLARVFDILRTGIVFVQFVASGAVFGQVGGIRDRRDCAALITNSVPAAVGFVISPSLSRVSGVSTA